MLYESFMTPCVKQVKSRVPDGEGGYRTAWSDGIEFEAAITKSSSSVVLLAEAKAETEHYTVTVGRDVELGFHDVFKRKSDGKTFRIGTANDPTPNVATFQFNQYQADAWELA